MQLRHHTAQLAERWKSYPIDRQILMIGSEFARAKSFLRSGAWKDAKECFERAYELLDLSADDPQWTGKRKELCRFREILGELYLSPEPDIRQCIALYRILLRWHPRTELVEP